MAKEKPESILLASHLWLWVVVLEIAHQILSIAMGFLTPEMWRKQVEDQIVSQQPNFTDAQINVTTYTLIAIPGVLAIGIMCVVLWMSLVLSRGGQYAGFARRTLLFFGVYLGIRLIIVFVPLGLALPDALVILDGCVQIVVSVCAIMAVYLVTRPESLMWTGEQHG